MVTINLLSYHITHCNTVDYNNKNIYLCILTYYGVTSLKTYTTQYIQRQRLDSLTPTPYTMHISIKLQGRTSQSRI